MEISEDTLFDGELTCLQHLQGYRFSLDPVLLAHFVRLKKEESVLDLGAGCGIIGLILLYRASHSIRALTSFELQPGLAALCRENAVLNSFQGKMRVEEGDLRGIANYFPAGNFSTVVCNPPFFIKGSGRKSINSEALIARHQVQCTLEEILVAAAYVLKNKGRLYLIYPAELLAFLIAALSRYGFALKRLRPVYSYPEGEGKARLILVDAVRNGNAGMEISSPLYIYEQKDGAYTKEVEALYRRNVK